MKQEKANNMLGRNLIQHHKRDLVRILSHGLECSESDIVQGAQAPYSFNLDRVLSDPRRAKKLLKILTIDLREHIEKVGTTSLVFIGIDNLSPRGIIQMRTHLSVELDIPTVICQPKRRIHAARICGDIGPSDRVTLVTDVITSGDNVARTFGICRITGATVVSVYSIFDKEETSAEGLKRLGIEQVCVAMRFREMRDQFTDEISANHYQTISKYEPTTEDRDYFDIVASTLYT